MKAEWKQAPLDQAQKKSMLRNQAKQIEELKKSVERLKQHVEMDKVSLVRLRDELAYTREQRAQAERNADRYNALRTQELMIMSKDGAKYLKDEELDKYADSIWGLGMKMGFDLHSKYAQALAQSMAQSKHVTVAQILKNEYVTKVYPMSFTVTEDPDYGDDTGSES